MQKAVVIRGDLNAAHSTSVPAIVVQVSVTWWREVAKQQLGMAFCVRCQVIRLSLNTFSNARHLNKCAFSLVCSSRSIGFEVRLEQGL